MNLNVVSRQNDRLFLNMKTVLRTTAAAVVCAMPLSAFALPEFSPKGRSAMARAQEYGISQAPQGIFNESYDFEGIVALNNCSGSLVRFSDSNPGDQGLILTNGHCVDLLAPGQVIFNEDSSRRFQVLSPTAQVLGSVTAQKLLFATMTRTDIGLYQLKETFEDVSEKFNTEPLTLAEAKPAVGTSIEIISGYWKRGYSCSIERIVTELREGRWTMFESVKYSNPGCEVIGGTSGSPIIEKGTRTVIAINNTGNEDGNKCTQNNPCEVDEKGNITWEKGWNYGQQTHWLYSCRNSEGQLDLESNGCLLPKPE